ncbi:MAG: hypothetical protein JRM71_06370 [Nitrososphaerota archaeon]|nr:hypothetical protein [Nitrososphaerota archaeon]MDG7010403.1 hypothetical protein [Nitrososphaerota archaeon]
MPRVDPGRTVAGGMQAAAPGEVTFGAARRFVYKIDLVNDTEIEDAIFGPLSLSHVLAEPAGAPPLAAMKGPLRGEPGDRVGLVIIGGNVAVDLLRSILTRRRR